MSFDDRAATQASAFVLARADGHERAAEIMRPNRKQLGLSSNRTGRSTPANARHADEYLSLRLIRQAHPKSRGDQQPLGLPSAVRARRVPASKQMSDGSQEGIRRRGRVPLAIPWVVRQL